MARSITTLSMSRWDALCVAGDNELPKEALCESKELNREMNKTCSDILMAHILLHNE